MKASIKKLLGKSKSELKSIGSKNREYVIKEYSAKNNYKELMGIYHEVL